MIFRKNERSEATARFLVNLVIVLAVSMLFYWIWDRFYHVTYVVYFYFWGNIALLVFYIFMDVLFNCIYGGFQIGYSTTTDLIFSQILSLFFCNIGVYLIGVFARKYMIPAGPLWLCLLLQVILTIVLNMIFNKVWYGTFPPQKTLMVYDHHDPSIYERIAKYQSSSYDIQRTIPFADFEKNAGIIEEYDCIIAEGLKPENKEKLVNACYSRNKTVYLIPDICDVIVNSAGSVYLVDTPVLKANNFGPGQLEKIVKRLFDIVFALVFLVLTSPIFLITAIAIKVNDHGPVFYRQTRLTQNGRKFEIIKFRSMKVNAEKDGVARLASEHDDRITSVGKFIRSCRIDELPQLINILKGDMSVVGPRPERPEIAEKIEQQLPEFSYRLKVKAGLTGYAQVYGKYNTKLSDKLLFDLIYIEHFSIGLDLRIMFMTFKILFKKDSTEGVADNQQLQ